MAWLYLALGIVFEVCGTTALKFSNGFTQSVPAAISIGCFSAALYFLSLSVRVLDLSTVYAIWSGVGVAIVAVIGVGVFGEALSGAKLCFIALIIVGVVGLQSQQEAVSTEAEKAGRAKENALKTTQGSD